MSNEDVPTIDSFFHHDMDRILTVSIVEHYGRETIRPECELSRNFAALLGQRTLTRTNINKIKELGYIIKLKEVNL